MQIFEYLLTDIKPYENNPRRNDDAVEVVANSIREFGWQQPIVIDTDGVIIAGHTRYKAALQLGLEKVPVVVADELTLDTDILEKKASAKTDMSMCDAPCRMTAPNNFVAQTLKERKDPYFI